MDFQGVAEEKKSSLGETRKTGPDICKKNTSRPRWFLCTIVRMLLLDYAMEAAALRESKSP
jgi:hypothetical protein